MLVELFLSRVSVYVRLQHVQRQIVIAGISYIIPVRMWRAERGARAKVERHVPEPPRRPRGNDVSKRPRGTPHEDSATHLQPRPLERPRSVFFLFCVFLFRSSPLALYFPLFFRIAFSVPHRELRGFPPRRKTIGRSYNSGHFSPWVDKKMCLAAMRTAGGRKSSPKKGDPPHGTITLS